MGNSPSVIVENNVSVAWGKAFLDVFCAGEISPLIVVIKDLSNADPPENLAIRNALDAALEADGRELSCHRVANTIFPSSLWNPKADRNKLYQRYHKIFPRIRRHQGNHNGLYFQRLISFGHSDKAKGVNQLEHIIQTWNRGNHRRSALQAALFDPHRDHTHQRQRGFPCLQQVAFARLGADGLTITGFYATQYLFGRAYGNYMGLCRLGHFMAQEMGLTLRQVVCIATPAVRDKSKKALKELAQQVESVLKNLAGARALSAYEGAHV